MERLLVEDWLTRWSGKSTFKKIWLPLLRAKLGDAYKRTSAAFIWAYIERMYKARRSGMKRELFGYLPGGYKRIIQKLLDRLRELQVQIVFDAQVHSVESKKSNSGVPQVTLEIRDKQATNQTRQLQFDRAILTAPYSIVSQSCPGLSTMEHQRLNDTEYLGVVCTSLLMKKPLSGYYVTNIIDDWVPLTGLSKWGRLFHLYLSAVITLFIFRNISYLLILGYRKTMRRFTKDVSPRLRRCTLISIDPMSSRSRRPGPSM